MVLYKRHVCDKTALWTFSDKYFNENTMLAVKQNILFCYVTQGESREERERERERGGSIIV